MASQDDARREFAERLEGHRRRHEIELDVEWLEESHTDSLPLRLYLTASPSTRLVEELDEFLIARHRVGVLGGFAGVVHDLRLTGLVREEGQLVYCGMLDLGSAERTAIDVLVRGLRGLKIWGLPVSKAVFGWTAEEYGREPEA
jgi:hypothetical protein